MNKEAKKELDKMLLLMERMDRHYTLDEALEMEDRIETKRDTYTDLDQFLSEVNLGSSFVGLGYIQGYVARKIYPTNPDINPSNGLNQADSIKAGFGKMDKNSRGWRKLNAMLNDPEFSNPTGRPYAGNRSMKEPHFAGVIKVTNYVFNWGDTSNLADFYDKYNDKVKSTRLQYGFGKDDSSYAADDWHRGDMYKGIGELPDWGDRETNGYRQKLNPANSLYGFSDKDSNPLFSTRSDGSQYQKRAFRFGIKNIEKQWAKYCLVDLNGEIDDIETSLGAILGNIPGNTRDLRKKIVPQMSQDEKDFINAISQIENERDLSEKTWLTDNIAYIVAGEMNPQTRTRRYVRWINPDIIIDKFDVNQNELKQLVNKEIGETEMVVRYKKPSAAEE